MGRHRHAINVRADGLGTVLGPLFHDPAVVAALLVDVDSGMVLDGCGDRPEVDHEELGAAHGDLMRLALGPATGGGAAAAGEPLGDCEIVVSRGGGRHLVLRRVPDTHGDRLALTVLVDGTPRALRRVRRRLGEVSAAALTAGPTVSLRPVAGTWVPATAEERATPAALPRRSPRALVRGPEETVDIPAARTSSPATPPAGDALAALLPEQARRARVLQVAPPMGQERPPAPPSALPPPLRAGS